MKKLAVFVMMFCVVISSNAQRKKSAGVNTDAAAAAVGVVGAVAAAAYYEHQMREMVEQSAMEWALMNKEYTSGDKLEMKLIEWEVKELSDISSTSNLLFRYRKNNEPYEVIMFLVSKGWWNENGVVFSKITPITIDKKLWNDIMGSFINIAVSDEGIRFQNDSIYLNTAMDVSVLQGKYYNYAGEFKTELNTDLSSILKLKGKNLLFEFSVGEKKYECKAELVKIKGDEHIIGLLNNCSLVLDYNENA